MAIWQLKIKRVPGNPIGGGYAEILEVMVQAPDEDQARAYARKAAADDGEYNKNKLNAWLEPQFTSCEEIVPDGEARYLTFYRSSE